MKNNHLFKKKFKIGEQFEKHEFDLDFFLQIKSRNGYNYEVFYLLKSTNDYKVFLAYNCDILSGIFIVLKEDYSNFNFNEIISVKKKEKKQEMNFKSVHLKENSNFISFTKLNWELCDEEIKEFVNWIEKA